MSLGTATATADEIAIRPSYYISPPDRSLYWTGFYVGVNGGYGFGNSSVSYGANDPAAQSGTCGGGGTSIHGQCIPLEKFNFDGPLAGGEIGYNWQINAFWVTGIEADYQWSDFSGKIKSGFRLGNVGATNMNADETMHSFGTVRLRMGVVVMNPLLVYGTAGLAYGRTGENVSGVSVASGSLASGGYSYDCTADTTCFAGSSSGSVWGWTAGTGAEAALTSNITLKTEILYLHFEAPTATVAAQSTTGAGPTPASFTATFAPVHTLILRGGMDFKF